MTTVRRKKGEVEWLRLGDLLRGPSAESIGDVKIGVRHEGPWIVREWGFALDAIRYDELKRILVLREGLTPDLAPELFDGKKRMEVNADGEQVEIWEVYGVRDENGNVRLQTSAGQKAGIELAVASMAQVVVGIKGSDIDAETDGTKIAEEMRRLGIADILFAAVMGVQGLTKAESFPSSDPGVV